jgi:dienelactone hydrolase
MEKLLTTVLVFFSLLLVMPTTIQAQPYQIGNYVESFTDASRSRNIETYIFYPATTNGSNATAASGQFPIIVFGHGFSMAYDAFSNIWESLVPQGYIVAMVNTETGTSVSHADFGLDLAFVGNAMLAESSNTASPINASILNKVALSGHSMGGGCTFLAAANNPNIDAIFTLGAAETTPSSTDAAANITVPTLVIAATNDCVAPTAEHQTPMYNQTAASCKYYVDVAEATHCNFTNGDGTIPFFSPAGNCYTAELLVGCGGSNAGLGTQQQRWFNLVLPWLNHWLKGEPSALATFETTVANTSDYPYFETNCIISNITAYAGEDITICSGTLTPTVLTAAGGTYYNWSTGDNSAIINVSPSTTTTYTVTVSDINGNSALDDVTINVSPAPNADAGMDATICIGDAVNITASGGIGYNWSNGSTDTSFSVSPSTTSTYFVTVTDNNGCTASDDVIINISTPTADAGIDVSICVGDAVSLTASGGISYVWDDGNTSTNPTVSPITNTTYTVTVSDVNGCTASDDVLVSVTTCGIVLQAKVWLEGAHGASSTSMRTDLLNNGALPLNQPYNLAPYNYMGTESVSSLAAFPSNTVDWVLLELRDPSNYSTVISTKSALLLADGSIVDTDGTSNGVIFAGITANSDYYLAVYHRNHLRVLSASPINLPNTNSYDLTNSNNIMGTNQVTNLGTNLYGLYAGNTNADRIISYQDFNTYLLNYINPSTYNYGDCNLDGIIDSNDFGLLQPNTHIIGINF